MTKCAIYLANIMQEARMTAFELDVYLKHKEISRTEFAELVGVSRRTVFRWLKGEAPIPKLVQMYCEQNP